MKPDISKTKLFPKLMAVRFLLLTLLLVSLVLIANKSHLRLLIRGHLDYARAQGYPTTMAKLYAFYEYPPPGENAADLYLEAFDYFVDWDEEDERLLPIFGEVQITPGQYMDEPTLQLVSQYLADNKETLNLLHRAAIFPQCRYPIESDDKFFSIDHYRGIRQSINLLALESLYYAHMQRFDLAAQTLMDSFALSNSLKNEPLLVSWLVKIACDEVNFSIVENIINLTPLPKLYLAEIENAITHIDYDDTRKKALRGEYAFAFEYNSICFNEKEQLLYLENLWNCLDILKLSMPERFRATEKNVSLDAPYIFNEELYKQAINTLWYSMVIHIRYETNKRLAIMTLAIERYRHDLNKLPDSLNDLAPRYLNTVIKDPYDGSDLRYKKLEIGYVVYSVGEDLTDNNGTKEDANGKSYAPHTDITFTVRR
jgi:hypothetical protein